MTFGEMAYHASNSDVQIKYTASDESGKLIATIIYDPEKKHFNLLLSDKTTTVLPVEYFLHKHRIKTWLRERDATDCFCPEWISENLNNKRLHRFRISAISVQDPNIKIVLDGSKSYVHIKDDVYSVPTMIFGLTNWMVENTLES